MTIGMTTRMIIIVLMIAGTVLVTPASATLNRTINDPFAIGVRLVRERSYAEPVELFEAAVKEDPPFVTAHLELARSLVMSGRRLDGLNRLAKAQRVAKSTNDQKRIRQQRDLLASIFYTNEAFQHFQDGLNLMRDRKTRGAIQSFEKALAKEPDNAQVLTAYGKALLSLDDRNQSIKLLERAHSILPERSDVRISLATGILNKDPKRAAALLRNLVAQSDVAESSVLTYVQALERIGKIRDAISVLRRTTSEHHDRLQSVFWLGKYYSLQPEGAWMARRYLMIFLRRLESTEASQKVEVDQKKNGSLDSLRRQAKSLLERINADLGVESLEG